MGIQIFNFTPKFHSHKTSNFHPQILYFVEEKHFPTKRRFSDMLKFRETQNTEPQEATYFVGNGEML